MCSIVTVLKQYAIDDFSMMCANDKTRRDHFILIEIFVDYEEQVLIIDVKSLQHCSICQVFKNKQKDLQKHEFWNTRTHEWTKSQIKRQHTRQWKKQYNVTNHDYVHSMKNFVWKHHLFNIHANMFSNILHQLLKEVAESHLLEWINAIVRACVRSNKKNKKSQAKRTRVSLLKAFVTIQLNQTYRRVSSFSNLKHFDHFSEIKQWTRAK